MNEYRYATVEPILQSSEDKLQWLGSIPNPIIEFPSRGSVHWPAAPVGLGQGDVWQFEIEEHRNYKGEPNWDKYIVKNPKPAVEIIDLRDYDSERDVRIVLTSEGVYLPLDPLCDECMIWVKDDLCVGPLQLVQQQNTGPWILASSVDRGAIRRTKISPEMVQVVKFDDTRYLLKPHIEGTHVGFVNWESDETLAGRVLSHLLKRDRKKAQALGVTKNVFQTYLDTIANSDLIGSDADDLEMAFRDRIADILETIARRNNFLEQIANVCFELDGVKERVTQRADEEYRKKLSEHSSRLDVDLKDKRVEIGQLEEELKENEQKLTAASARLQSLDDEIEQRVQRFDSVLTERLQELTAKPERLFAELAITNALLPKQDNVTSFRGSNVSSRAPLPQIDVPCIVDPTAFLSGLCVRIMACGISPIVGLNLHSLLLAGSVPILIGKSSFDVISAYADCISGGRLHWVPISGTLFEPSDLLARFDPTSRNLIPHPSGIIDLLLDESDSMHIVVLDGFNRAAVDGYLIPLLKSVHDVASGMPLPRSIPLAPHRLMSQTDIYADISQIAWKRNVLLILVPSIGTSTLPVPAELWEWCSIIGTDKAYSDAQSATNEKKRVKASDWDNWRQGARQGAETVAEMNKPLPEFEYLPPAILKTAERIVGAVTFCNQKKEEAWKLYVKTCLYPYLVSQQAWTEQLYQHLNIAPDTLDRQIADTVRQLGE
ncbi:MAG: hypothetical protein R3C14_21125 [Caldilineaceae bacterium]